MFKTIATSSSHQLLLKSVGYGLENEDLTVMIQALTFARDELDMDNMDAVHRLGEIIEALELAINEEIVDSHS